MYSTANALSGIPLFSAEHGTGISIYPRSGMDDDALGSVFSGPLLINAIWSISSREAGGQLLHFITWHGTDELIFAYRMEPILDSVSGSSAIFGLQFHAPTSYL